MLQKGQSVLWKSSIKELTEIVLLLCHHAAVDLPNDVRYGNTMYTETLILVPVIVIASH